MDDYNDYKKLRVDESIYFPETYGIKEKTISEFIRLLGFYYDSGINEVTFTSNDRERIDNILKTIRELINKEEYILAQYYIVSLQLVLGLEVRLVERLRKMIEEKVDIDLFIRHKPESKNSNVSYEDLRKDTIDLLRESRKQLAEMRRKKKKQEEDNDKGKGFR